MNIKFFIENKTNFDWPACIRIKGKSSTKLTGDLDIEMPEKVKAFSMTGIRFKINYEKQLLKQIKEDTVYLQFIGIDKKNNIKYFSDMMKLRLNKGKCKKFSIFNICNYIN